MKIIWLILTGIIISSCTTSNFRKAHKWIRYSYLNNESSVGDASSKAESLILALYDFQTKSEMKIKSEVDSLQTSSKATIDNSFGKVKITGLTKDFESSLGLENDQKNHTFSQLIKMTFINDEVDLKYEIFFQEGDQDGESEYVYVFTKNEKNGTLDDVINELQLNGFVVKHHYDRDYFYTLIEKGD